MDDDRLDPEELAALWDFSDLVASEARFRESIAARDAFAPATLELRTQLARALGLQGQFDEATAMLGAIESPNERVMTRKYLELGRVLNSAGSPHEAVPCFREALRLAQNAGDSYLEVDTYHMLAIADRDNTEKWMGLGLAIAETSDNKRVRVWYGILSNNRAWTLHESGDYSLALTGFKIALEIFEECGGPEQIHYAKWSVARCLRSLGRNDEAMVIQQRLAAEDPPDPYVDEELAKL